MKKCKRCGQEIVKNNPKSNNVVFCSASCRVSFYQEHPSPSHTKEARDLRNHEKYNKFVEGKYKCPVCGGWYFALLRHTWQRHGITEKEFKDNYGIRHKQSFIQDDEKEIKRESIKQHEIIPLLLKNGAKTRIKKGQKILGKRNRKTSYEA